MDIRTILTTLSLLGTGAALTACNKTGEATEVPGAATEASEASCGGDKSEASCGGDKSEASCGGDKSEASCGGDKDGETPMASDAGDEANPPTPVAASVAPSSEPATNPEPATKPKPKQAAKSKKKKGVEEACGEGTCG